MTAARLLLAAAALAAFAGAADAAVGLTQLKSKDDEVVAVYYPTDGEAKAAREHFLKSLKLWPHQPELMKPLLFASLPFKSGVALLPVFVQQF